MNRSHRILFGYFAVPLAAEYERIPAHARLADELGLDLVGIQDHPYQPRFLDALTLLTAIAVQTTRLRVLPDVVNLQMRRPAMVAKWAASLDVMTGGRVELGLGAGGFAQAVAAMGEEARQPADAVSALEEAIPVIRAMWSGRKGARVEGRYYRLAGVHAGPVPAHPIGIWLGAYRPRMLAITGRLADGWLPSLGYMPTDKLPEANARIDEAATGAGRDPASILRMCNVGGRITDGESGGFLEGPVDQWVDQLTELVVDYGMDGFISGNEEDPEHHIRRLATEVAPKVRENVGIRLGAGPQRLP